MKILIYIITLMMVLSCGNRNVANSKSVTQIANKTVAESQHQTNSTSNTEAFANLQNFLDQYEVSILNAKDSYQLGFSGLSFTGNADLTISKKNQSKFITTYSRALTTYKSETSYKSVTNYKTVTTYKSKESESQKPMIWLYVLIFCTGFFLKPFLKLITKK